MRRRPRSKIDRAGLACEFRSFERTERRAQGSERTFTYAITGVNAFPPGGLQTGRPTWNRTCPDERRLRLAQRKDVVEAKLRPDDEEQWAPYPGTGLSGCVVIPDDPQAVSCASAEFSGRRDLF